MPASREEPQAAAAVAAAGSSRPECSERGRRRSDRSALWHGLCATATALATSGSVGLQVAALALQFVAPCLIGLDRLSLTPELVTIALLAISHSLLRLVHGCMTSSYRCFAAVLCRRRVCLARSGRVVACAADGHDHRSPPSPSRGRALDSDARRLRPRRSRFPDPDERPRGRTPVTDVRRQRPRRSRSDDDDRSSVDVNDFDDRHRWHSDVTAVGRCARNLLSGVNGATFLSLWTRVSRLRPTDGDHVWQRCAAVCGRREDPTATPVRGPARFSTSRQTNAQ